MSRSAVHYRYVALGATFERVAGWDLPVSFPYGDATRASTAAFVLGDESAVGKFHLEGADLKVSSTAFPSVTYVIKPGVSLVVVPPARRAAALEKFAAPGTGCAHALDVSSSYASFVLAGSRALDVFAALATADLGAVAEGAAVSCGLAGHPAIVGRHAKGWRILTGRDEAEELWDQIIGATPEIVIASWSTIGEWLW